MEVKLWKLSKEFASESDLRDVAIIGRKIRSKIVDKYINDNKNDVNIALIACLGNG